jgi:hypothetical protein
MFSGLLFSWPISLLLLGAVALPQDVQQLVNVLYSFYGPTLSGLSGVLKSEPTTNLY